MLVLSTVSRCKLSNRSIIKNKHEKSDCENNVHDRTALAERPRYKIVVGRALIHYG